MQRYFTSKLNQETKTAVLEGADFHHVKNVMRLKVDDQIIVCDLNSNCYLSTIKEINKEVNVILDKILGNTELPVKVDIAQGLIRREKFEYMLQKSTELGVRSIIPVKGKYSIVQLDQTKLAKKQERWNKITKEASEQAHRNVVVNVEDIKQSYKEIDYSKYDVVLVAYENEVNSTNLHHSLQQIYQKILVVIGPEGGLHPDEIAFFKSIKNVELIGLGKRILRSETASSYVLSVIGYRYEMGDLL
jgi:16S rRNA (uracil1498-N3)-methyltransferase